MPALYPRARGADSLDKALAKVGTPLPPRTRGRPGSRDRTLSEATSTPAHAGPTRRSPRRPTRRCLYPRARGADLDEDSRIVDFLPLPPRTRGRRVGR